MSGLIANTAISSRQPLDGEDIKNSVNGVSQCEVFAEVCLVADYLSQNLPSFCCERIEKPVIEWEAWLRKINQKNKWHHVGSPIIWKEMLLKGGKARYIGGASEFLEYCHSYYEFDSFLAPEKISGLAENLIQYQQKVKLESREIKHREAIAEVAEKPPQTSFIVSISGAGHPLAMHLISGLLEMAVGKKSISKIYLYDENCQEEFMDFVERECSFVESKFPGKVVKYVDKIGVALAYSDLLIILDHAPYDENKAIGDWLHDNKNIMSNLSFMINISASRKIYILFPNIGPACYNATVLSELIHLKQSNVVVATSDLGLEISSVVAEIAEISQRNMFCPPVWGFVGINHLVDIKTTVHRYNSFEPFNRYLKVKNSTLLIGSLTPELRTLEYLMYYDESLWKKVAANKSKFSKGPEGFNKALAVLNVVKLWLFDQNPDHIVNLGIKCNGTFGLTFKGKFSQPSRFLDGEWVPAEDYLLPKDPHMTLKYLQEMAEYVMNLHKGDLPKIVPYYPCTCKKKYYKKKPICW